MRLAYTQNSKANTQGRNRLYLNMLGSFENRDYELSRNRNYSNRNFSGRKFYRRGGDLSTPIQGASAINQSFRAELSRRGNTNHHRSIPDLQRE